MGKFVILPTHASNQVFRCFPNCLFYKTDEELMSSMEFAERHAPASLTAKEKNALSWQGASRRLLRTIDNTFVRKRLNLGCVVHRYVLGSFPINDYVRSRVGVRPMPYSADAARNSTRLLAFLLILAMIKGKGIIPTSSCRRWVSTRNTRELGWPATSQ